MKWEYFTKKELECKCGCGKADMNPDFMRKLVRLRRSLGFAFPLTSAYRCPEHNQNVSSTGPNGPHTTGRAVDICISGKEALRLITAARGHGMTGFGIKQHGPHGARFIHLDDLDASVSRPRPWIWTYGKSS